MDTKIQELVDRRSAAQNLARKYTNAIEALQLICEHKWVCLGHDSHKDHYECEHCGEEDIY